MHGGVSVVDQRSAIGSRSTMEQTTSHCGFGQRDGFRWKTLRLAGAGRLTLANRSEYSSRMELTKSVGSLPAPVFIREGILSLPWHANRNHYPAVMDDFLFYRPAVRRGALTEYPIKLLVTSHHFRSLLVDKQDPARWALQTGCELSSSQDFSKWSLTRVNCSSNEPDRPNNE